MSYATRTQLLSLAERHEVDYQLPDGQFVRIRELTAPEYQDAIAAGEPGEDGLLTNLPAFYAMLTIASAIDGPRGQPLFTRDDLPSLTQARHPRNGWSLPRVVGDAAWTLSEVGPESLKSVGDTSDPAGVTDEDVRTGEAHSGDAGAGSESGDRPDDGTDGPGGDDGGNPE